MAMTSAQRIGISALSLLVMTVAIFLLALNGYAPLVAFIGGLWWGVVPITLLFGAPMTVAPARMIRWREAAMAQRGEPSRIGIWFSKHLCIAGPRPWESAVARHRVRTLGRLYVVLGLGVGLVFLLLRF